MFLECAIDDVRDRTRWVFVRAVLPTVGQLILTYIANVRSWPSKSLVFKPHRYIRLCMGLKSVPCRYRFPFEEHATRAEQADPSEHRHCAYGEGLWNVACKAETFSDVRAVSVMPDPGCQVNNPTCRNTSRAGQHKNQTSRHYCGHVNLGYAVNRSYPAGPMSPHKRRYQPRSRCSRRHNNIIVKKWP